MRSKYEHVFSPIKIRGIDFKNRIVLAPPSPNLASTDGLITPQFVDWFRMFARGGVCTLYVGNCSIDIKECKDEAFQLDLSDDRCIWPLTLYADMGKQYGCHASLEINHNGENTAFETVGHAPYSSSPNISSTERTRAAKLGRDPIPAIEMTKEKIDETVEKYANAAARMKRAGMDICLVHGGHGNLISQFTSPLYNHRTDEYGGSLENRARFAIEVCDAIRRKVGEDFVIEFRISADEIAEEGMHFEETLQLIGLLKDHIDILHVSAGLHSDFNMKYYRNWCQNYMMDRCFNVHYARDIKKAYPDLLVTTVGSITSIDYAEEIIAKGWADFVAMCRPLMADPDMPRKYAENRPEDRRPCLRCDTCTKHLFVPKPIYCAVNPISAMTSELRDGVIPKAPVKKKVAVIGGGPAGIQAMETLLERGHDVTLYEKTGSLGGNVQGAALPPFKIDCQDYLKWLKHTAAKCQAKGAKILLNTEATKDMLDVENYEAIIIAIGADPIIPSTIPGIEKKHVHWTPDAEADKTLVGEKIVIVGAGSLGIEAAIEFHDEGKKVTVIEMKDPDKSWSDLMEAAGPVGVEFQSILKDKGIPVKYYNRLKEICDNKVICDDLQTGQVVEYEADTVLLAMGMCPRTNKVEELRHCAPETNVYIVGDCYKVGTIGTAVNQAFQAALHI
ncbi:MAG: FAD-dependent oxidoreductase [Peptococcaceae bacterium]|mgnify:CR=1 FL=1|nr:FAD-dependent oxidoreductase [Peptococcaceae bacterium]